MTAHDYILLKNNTGRMLLTKQYIVSLQEDGTATHVTLVNGKQFTLTDAKFDDLYYAMTEIDYEAD